MFSAAPSIFAPISATYAVVILPQPESSAFWSAVMSFRQSVSFVTLPLTLSACYASTSVSPP